MDLTPTIEVTTMPKGWRQVRLVNFAAKQANATVGGPFGSDLVAKDYVGSGVPVVRGQNMGRSYVSGEFAFVKPAKAKALQANLAKPFDLVFTQRGTLGQVALVPPAPFDEYLISQSQMKLTVDREAADPGYVYQYFISEFGRKQILDSAIQTGVPHTNLGILRNYLVPMPQQLEEQRFIATVLSEVDDLVNSMGQVLTKKRQIKQGAMQELLTGKRRLRQVADWHLLRLGDAATLRARIGWQGLTTAEYRERGDHLLVTGTEFAAGRICWDSCHYVDQDRYDQDKNIQLASGDVLVTKDGTIGKAALIDSLPMPATLNSGIFVVRPKNNAFHPGFFYYLLASSVFSSFLGQLSAGSTINHLYQKDFVHFRFRAPKDLDEQRDIFEVIAAIDSEIAAIESRLSKACALKQSMAQALLTGLIRLVEPNA